MPKVTVLMPVYNVGAYVDKAIRSILRQTYQDFVLLIMDDGSTDDTAARVMRFKDARIRYERNERNLGLADNLNRGLSLIDTEYVARFDGDDIAEPDWLEANMQVLESHPEIGICSSGFQWFGTRKGTILYPEHHKDSMCQMLFGCTVIVPVYNIEPYIKECLDSISAQTYENLEILAVNDGSTDQSKAILEVAAFDEARGKDTGSGYIYMLLKRHGWRKVMPRSKHPKAASEEACEASKKLNSVCWIPEKTCSLNFQEQSV